MEIHARDPHMKVPSILNQAARKVQVISLLIQSKGKKFNAHPYPLSSAEERGRHGLQAGKLATGLPAAISEAHTRIQRHADA